MDIKGISHGRIHQRGSSLIYHVGALVAVTAWGIAFINSKVLLQSGLSAVEIYVYRFIIAYLCVFVVCPRPLWSNNWSDELKFFLCGVCGNSVYFIAENTALNYTLVTNVSLIVTTSPILTALLLGTMYRSERPSKGFMTGSLIAFFGVACVIFNSSFVLKVNPLGDMLALLAAVCWAIYSVLLRPLNAVYGVWFITRKTFFYGILTSLPFLAVEPHLCGLETLLSVKVLGNLCFLAMVCSVLAYVLWANAIKRIGVMKSGNYLYVSPIVTLIASAVYLGEKVSVIGYLGCFLILVGVILSEKLNSKMR
ncbi:MAG: DMT family transporter [Bacteroides sp.]|nr:DMT family transporter [Bacteroides sp.]MCM1413461.1 DMT family transporter [Bacteroides sp.]MCM1471328.1 DMT family transporter [Bacteroides sp.]